MKDELVLSGNDIELVSNNLSCFPACAIDEFLSNRALAYRPGIACLPRARAANWVLLLLPCRMGEGFW